jgi:hypothetical protein
MYLLKYFRIILKNNSLPIHCCEQQSFDIYIIQIWNTNITYWLVWQRARFFMVGKIFSCRRVIINISTIQPESNFGHDAVYRPSSMHLHVMLKGEVAGNLHTFQSQITSTCPLKFNQNLTSARVLYVYNFKQCYQTGNVH